MKILVSENKRIYCDKSFLVEGENKADKLEFEFPSELENYIKFIVISSDEGKYIDLIIDNEYIITRAISQLHNISIAVICTNSQIASELTKVEDLTDIENEIEFRSLSVGLPTMDFLVNMDTIENDNNPSAIARVYKEVLKNTEDIDTIKENQENLKQNFENLETLKNEAVQATESMQELKNTIESKLENGEFNGRDGVDGKDGKNGNDGADGQDGKDGRDGADGYTPQKGVDYYTEEDKAELKSEIEENLSNQILLKNMIFNTVEGESIDIDDAYTYDKNCLKIFGNIKQVPEPDPNSPSEIKPVKENIHFSRCGRNLFNFNKIQTVSTVLKNEDGSFTSSNNVILIGVNFESVPFSGLKLNKNNYYLQFKIRTNSEVTLNNLFICTRNKENVANNIGKSINKELKANTETIIETKFELTELKEKVGIVAYLSSSVDFTVYDVMICKDINDTKFEQYYGKNYTLAVQKELFEEDYFTKDEEVHCWKEMVLTGTEPGFNMAEWETSLINVYSFRMNLGNGLIKGTKICSNYFEEKGLLFNKDFAGMKCAENNTIDFHIQKELLEDGTIQSFKNWLKQKHDEGNPVTIYYKSSEEERLQLTEEQKAVVTELYDNFELAEGVNYISSDDEVSPIFKLEYMQSNKILNQRKDEKIKNIESRLALLEV